MMPVSAAWVAAAVGGTLVGSVTAPITSVVKDSREARPGSLYVAFPGERADGHDFVASARHGGAVCALVTRPVDGPHILVDDASVAIGALAKGYLARLRGHGHLTVVAITGSVGKTTTKDLLAQMLPQVVAPIGSYNNEIGLPMTVLSADESTRHLVLEMGASGVGHISHLTDIAPPDIAVVLAVGHAHMGAYASLDDVADAKAEIIRGRVPGGAVILNGDDHRVFEMRAEAPDAIIYGSGHGSVRAEHIESVHGRPAFTLVIGDDEERVSLRLVGEHQVSNALAAAAVAHILGRSAADIARDLGHASAISKHRMAITPLPGGVTLIDDSYNASPESVAAALRALKDVAAGGRTFAVLGEMLELGDESVSLHREIGTLVVRLRVSHTLAVGQGARPIFDAAVHEGSWADEAAWVATIGEARRYLDSRLSPGDTVLLKGSHGSGIWKLADDLSEGAA